MKGYVAYKSPNSDTITIQKGTALTYSELNTITDSNSFIFNTFNSEENYLITNLKSCNLSDFEIYFNTDNNFCIKQDEYIKNCNELIIFLNQSKLDKVILSRLKKIKNDFDPIELFNVLNTNYKNTFNYLISIEGMGSWIGSTPEMLLTRKKNNFKTVSIAGTKKSENIEWGNKELEEQQIVTDYISNTLKQNSISFTQSESETIKAGHVFHLRTKFKGLINTNLSTLIKALHPTPATCGLPKIDAKLHIETIEKHNRKFYTGFLGSTSKDNTNLFVNLRCLEIQKKQCYLYLGGGITTQSIPEDEWNETENKANTLLQAISLIT